jgi:hypothetical protein
MPQINNLQRQVSKASPQSPQNEMCRQRHSRIMETALLSCSTRLLATFSSQLRLSKSSCPQRLAATMSIDTYSTWKMRGAAPQRCRSQQSAFPSTSRLCAADFGTETWSNARSSSAHCAMDLASSASVSACSRRVRWQLLNKVGECDHRPLFFCSKDRACASCGSEAGRRAPQAAGSPARGEPLLSSVNMMARACQQAPHAR